MNETAQPPKQSFFRLFWWVLRIYWKMFPLPLIIIILGSIFLDISSLIYSFIFAKLIDTLVNLAAAGSSKLDLVYPILLMLMTYVILEKFVRMAWRYNRRMIHIVSRNRLRKIIYDKLQQLGIQTLEKPE